MTESPRPLVRAFPAVGLRMELAYRQLAAAADASGSPAAERLSRPWDVASCADPALRLEVWQWLDEVVDWINSEHVWATDAMIPACWPLHPHLVHDLGTLADQRRTDGLALTSDPLEEWHRYALPAFTERMRQRLKDSCATDHQVAPGAIRRGQYRDRSAAEQRGAWYLGDGARSWERIGPDAPTLGRE